MKTNYLIIIVLLISYTSLHAQWSNIYKQEKINIIADKNYGNKTDWDSILYNYHFNLTVSHDGRFFMTDSHNHKVYIINTSGDIIKEFGQKGQGPSDLMYPSSPTILDKKYLMVQEFARYFRISVFDLNGNFIKILKTKRSPYKTVALKNNKIAYMSHEFRDPTDQKYRKDSLIIIKDIQSGIEKTVDTITTYQYSSKISGNKLHVTTFSDSVLITGTHDNNLAVAATNRSQVDIFNEEGKKIRAFPLNLKPIPVTEKFIEESRKVILAGIAEKIPKNRRAQVVKLYNKVSFKDFFGSHLPMFTHITTDSDGNTLVFKFNTDYSNKSKTFQVYSPEGKFICETSLKGDTFTALADQNRQRLIFSKNTIIGLFKQESEDDTLYKFIRVNLK